MGIIQQIEAAQTVISKEELTINTVRNVIKQAVSGNLFKIACCPAENIRDSEIISINTDTGMLFVVVAVYFSRNPAVKPKNLSEEIRLDIPEIYFDYLLESRQESDMKKSINILKAGEEELKDFLDYQISERLMKKFIVPNINRILAEG